MLRMGKLICQGKKRLCLLDEYRKQEIANMESLLKDKKSKLNDDERRNQTTVTIIKISYGYFEKS